MSLDRLKTSTRIYIGFGLLIVLGLAIAAFGYWGIDGLGHQNVRMDALSGNLRYVATAIQNEEVVARVLLRGVNEPAAENQGRIHQALDQVREAMTQAKDKTLSPLRRGIYLSTLEKLDAQAQSADQSIELGRALLAARTSLFTGGDMLTGATAKLVDAARATDGEGDDVAAAKVDHAVLLVRVANWRFLATRDKSGPVTFNTNVTAATAALQEMDKYPGLAPAIAPVRAALAAYADAFKVVSASVISLSDIYENVQRPMVNTMIADLAKADASLGQDILDAATVSADLRASTSETQITVAAVGLIGGLALAFFIARGIVGPLTGMTKTMATLAAGDHRVTIPGSDRTDEIGDMARAVEVFKTNMIETERVAAEQEAARAARSRRQDAMDQHTRAFGTSVAAVMAALGSGADNMRKSADVMSEAASAVHAEASTTADGAGKSSADLTAVAAAVEQFSASVAEISRQVSVASEVATQAVQRADSSQATIRGLADSTARIGDVVRLIDTIASQTNLLALNATIEAARAGDAGKGFAVVAGEVKALAAQTAKATAEIGAQIETVRGATDDTVNAMNEIGSIIGRMGEVSTAISAAVEEQSVTTREIASSIQGVAGSTAQAAEAMGHVVQVADRAGDASRNILSEAADIGAESDKLRLQVEAFLQAVQTDSGERRRFERMAGNGVSATLTISGTAPVKAVLHNLSRTGAALRHRVPVPVGREVQIDLPDAGGPVTGQVIRSSDGIVAIALGQTPAMLARVDKALASLTADRVAA